MVTIINTQKKKDGFIVFYSVLSQEVTNFVESIATTFLIRCRQDGDRCSTKFGPRRHESPRSIAQGKASPVDQDSKEPYGTMIDVLWCVDTFCRFKTNKN